MNHKLLNKNRSLGRWTGILVLGAIVLASCSNSLTPEEYLNWMDQESDLIVGRQGPSFEYEAYYRPADYMVLLRSRKEPLTIDRYNRLIEEMKETINIQFRIHTIDKQGEALKANLTDPSGYYARLSHLSENVRYDFKLVVDQDTVPCTMHHFERTYGIQPFVNLLLAFDTDKDYRKGGFILIYNDRLFDQSDQEFHFEPKQLKQLPQIKIES